jgi:hypothetical protein
MRVFYKFRSHRSSEDLARTLRIISEGQIYAAKLDELNDPSEGWFAMAYGCEDDIETAKTIQKIRVVSLCRFYSNALLWSYYAESYSGVCLALSFPGDAPEPVDYNGLKDNVWRDRHEGGHELAAQRQARRKLDYWKHELEYRVIKLADSEDNEIFVPCVIHGALFGANTPPEVKASIQDAGKSVNSNFFTDVVELSQGLSHPCLGSGLGVRPTKMNDPLWLNDGAGPFSRPAANTCSKCGEAETGDAINGFFLEEHLLNGVDIQNYYAEKNTILLCPSCHRKAHLDLDY